MVSDNLLLDISSNLLHEEIELLLSRDSLLSDGRVSVNLTTEGKLTTCWARRPTRRDKRRYRRVLRRARRRVLSKEKNLLEPERG